MQYKFKKQKKLFIVIGCQKSWGHAEDYVEAMWKILQCKKPDDFICTGKQYSIKEFINVVSKALDMKIKWKGKGIKKKLMMKKITVLLNVVKNILDLLRLIH